MPSGRPATSGGATSATPVGPTRLGLRKTSRSNTSAAAKVTMAYWMPRIRSAGTPTATPTTVVTATATTGPSGKGRPQSDVAVARVNAATPANESWASEIWPANPVTTTTDSSRTVTQAVWIRASRRLAPPTIATATAGEQGGGPEAGAGGGRDEIEPVATLDHPPGRQGPADGVEGHDDDEQREDRIEPGPQRDGDPLLGHEVHGQGLERADPQPGRGGPAERAEPAGQGRGQGGDDEAGVVERADPTEGGDEDADGTADHRRQHPVEGAEAHEVVAEEDRPPLALGRGPGGQPERRPPVDEREDRGQHDDGPREPQAIDGERPAEEVDVRPWQDRRGPYRLGPEVPQGQALEDDDQPDGGHDDGQRLGPPQRSEHDEVGQGADRRPDGEGQRGRAGEPERLAEGVPARDPDHRQEQVAAAPQLGVDHRRVHRLGPEGEVDDAGAPMDHDHPEGQAGVQRPGAEPEHEEEHRVTHRGPPP